VLDVVGASGLRSAASGRPGAVRAALQQAPPALSTLTRLFMLGDDVDADDAAAALDLDASAPLLTRNGSRVAAVYDVAPHADETHDWWVVSDRTDAGGRPLRPDHVLGVGGASTTLAQLTVRRPVERALDIGTGCGVQALHLSTHCGHVTATDLVPRALDLAATSFALSGVVVDLLGGDLTEAVAGREFDLVVCNPPFVVGPAARFAYRDASWSGADSAGDALSRRAVRAAAGVLADGGVAHLLVNWLHVAGEEWQDRVGAWVSDLGVDALMLERDAQTPDDYVATWLADAGEDDANLVGQWMDWFRAQRIEAVGFGWVVLRRSAAPHRVAVERAPQPVDLPLGLEVGAWLDRLDWLRGRTDADLLAHAFRSAPGLRRDVASYVATTGGWQTAAASLGLDSGFRWSLPCDQATADLVAACDGERPLGAIAAVLAVTAGRPEAEVADAVCATVRGLVDRGVLRP
jgi:methylase of polypeptide subunit release factors